MLQDTKITRLEVGLVIAAMLIGLALMLLAPTPADAAAEGPECAGEAEMLARLADRHQQEQGRGVSRHGTLVRLHVDPAGLWSILVTDGKGLSCVQAKGRHWEPSGPQRVRIEQRAAR